MLFNGKRIHVRSLRRAENILWRKGIGKTINIRKDFYDYKDMPVAFFWSYERFLNWVNESPYHENFGVRFRDVAKAISFMEGLGYKFSVTNWNIN